MHWFWRAVIAIGVTAVYYSLNVVHPPVIDIHGRIDSGIRAVFSSWLGDKTTRQISSRDYIIEPAWRFRVSKSIAWGVPLALIPLAVYGGLSLLASRKTDGETRCRKCGYILRGISEPRCPECGERI
ncbi:hypothetical protein JW848_04530 [Candidatus Bipolaricaulota bacterium]|nr:hypothetical protein [Candidatus Bipolaricaulota bacterium]